MVCQRSFARARALSHRSSAFTLLSSRQSDRSKQLTDDHRALSIRAPKWAVKRRTTNARTSYSAPIDCQFFYAIWTALQGSRWTALQGSRLLVLYRCRCVWAPLWRFDFCNTAFQLAHAFTIDLCGPLCCAGGTTNGDIVRLQRQRSIVGTAS